MSDQQEQGLSEQELRAILKKNTGPIGALTQALSLAGRTALVGVPLAVAFAGINTAGAQLVANQYPAVAAMAPDELATVSQVLGGLGGFFALYAMIQFPKRARASRVSWLPALFALPLLMLMGAFMLAGSGQGGQMGLVVLQFLVMPWTLLWACFGGAAAAIGWVRAGAQVERGESVDLGSILGEIKSRTLEISAPHGGRQQAVMLGMQVLVPGIFYWLQLAFADMVAILDPERASLKRSGALTYGMRGRLFRLGLVWFLISTALSLGVGFLIEGSMEPIWGAMLDMRAISPLTFFAQDLVFALASWVLELAFLVLYFERERQVTAKVALRRLEKAKA